MRSEHWGRTVTRLDNRGWASTVHKTPCSKNWERQWTRNSTELTDIFSLDCSFLSNRRQYVKHNYRKSPKYFNGNEFPGVSALCMRTHFTLTEVTAQWEAHFSRKHCNVVGGHPRSSKSTALHFHKEENCKNSKVLYLPPNYVAWGTKSSLDQTLFNI